MSHFVQLLYMPPRPGGLQGRDLLSPSSHHRRQALWLEGRWSSGSGGWPSRESETSKAAGSREGPSPRPGSFSGKARSNSAVLGIPRGISKHWAHKSRKDDGYQAGGSSSQRCCSQACTAPSREGSPGDLQHGVALLGNSTGL